MNDQKLKPCPFCGGDPKIKRIFGGAYAVICECGAYMDAGSYLDNDETQKAKSARAWNRRASDGVISIADCMEAMR